MQQNLYLVGCPNGYRPASKKTADICLENFCPIPNDMQVEECMKSCNDKNDCHLFNHINIGKFRQCFLYGYDEDEGVVYDSRCGNKLGSTCCEKGK